jgi:SAM-dependent methyltransferase
MQDSHQRIRSGKVGAITTGSPDKREYEYKGVAYPEYLKHGHAYRFILEAAKHFCRGEGFDVGAGGPVAALPGAIAIDVLNGNRHHALNLPDNVVDYVFSSHCLEHLENPVAALEHWKSRLKPGGVLFLYLPHPDMEYWRPENCRKHRHIWTPERMKEILETLGFQNVLVSGRDLAWSFAAVGFAP